MSRLCIIPARGGSKRIPRKNIRPFLGKPIIAYSIEAALASGLFDEVMVSTDDEEIAEVARSFGASVPFLRSAATADDFATTMDVLAEVHARYATAFEQACCIYATAPFVSAELLRRAAARLDETGGDCVFPVLRYGFPVQRALRMAGDGGVSLLRPEYLNSRSQDLEPSFHDCGMFYFYRPETVLSKGKIWTDASYGVEVGETAAHDIDTPEDWKMAELKYKFLHDLP